MEFLVVLSPEFAAAVAIGFGSVVDAGFAYMVVVELTAIFALQVEALVAVFTISTTLSAVLITYFTVSIGVPVLIHRAFDETYSYPTIIFINRTVLA